MPGAYIAGRLCGGVDPARFFGTLVGLMFLAFAIAAAGGVPDPDRGAIVIGLVILSIVPSALATIPMVLAHRSAPAPVEMPPAQIVER